MQLTSAGDQTPIAGRIEPLQEPAINKQLMQELLVTFATIATNATAI
jgi:hypothetical protein